MSDHDGCHHHHGHAAPASAAPTAAAGALFTCPMHPEVQQEGPGACPDCGMALEPMMVAGLETRTEYTCPMHPEVRQDGPGACPDCGMALEPVTITLLSTRTEYICPMHPEVVRDEPGDCPICGMALEPKTVTAEEPPNPELIDMTRRFVVSTVLAVPLLAIAMSDMLPSRPLHGIVPGAALIRRRS